MNMRNPNEMRALTTVSDPRWAAVMARDASADGSFFYSVRTTGVYCRPSCGARQARPENVTFHATAADAERAGFRPCRRCKPDAPAQAAQHAAMVAEQCRFIGERDRSGVRAAPDVVAHEGGVVMQIDDDVADPGLAQHIEPDAEQRPPVDRHQALGQDVGQRPQPRSDAGGRKQRLGCRAHVRNRSRLRSLRR